MTKMKIIAEPVSVRENKSKKTEVGESVIMIGPLPILKSKLAKPRTVGEDDKFEILFRITKDERNEIIKVLAPVAVEVAEASGLKVTLKEAESILKAKMKELNEEEGVYKVGIYERMAFFKQDGTNQPVDIAIAGPEKDKPLDSLYLETNSEGMATFLLQASVYDKKVTFPFRLKAVKISKPIYWEPPEDGEGRQYREYGNFDKLNPDY